MSISNIFIVSTNRSDYGLLQILIKRFFNLKEYNLLVVRLIKKNGEDSDETVKINWNEKKIIYTTSSHNIKQSINGLLEIGSNFKDLIFKYSPKLIFLLRDRYELLPIVSQSLIANINIAHISGGEITSGVIDDKVRNMVSFASKLHLVAHNQAKSRLELILGEEESKNIHVVGEPGLEEIKKTNLRSITDLSEAYSLNLNQKFILCTLHPETNNKNFFKDASIFFETLLNFDTNYPLLISFGNHDPIGFDLNQLMQETLSKRSNTYICNSFGQLNFWSLLSHAHIIIGNSSSGLVEAPFLGCWTIDVGSRQNGRIFGNTVKRIAISKTEINYALVNFLNKNRSKDRISPYGDGQTSDKILNIVEDFLKDGF